MNTYRVVIDDGSATTHCVVVRATCHEYAEQLALLVARVAYAAVRRMSVKPLWFG